MDDQASIELPRDDGFSVETQLLHANVERSLFGTEGAPVRLGRFVVVDRIGRGAVGVVYRAFDPELGRMVAIKVLAREGEAHAERTRLEAQILARLNHPNVVTVHEVGIEHGRLFVAMEFVDGMSLARWSEEHQVYDAARVRVLIRMFEQAAQGLLAAHRAGIVHRDLKPSNILVDREGRVRIADFGLARIEGEHTGEDQGRTVASSASSERLTSTGTVVGTPAYMAPEQFAGSADERSDQFGLCAAFFDAFHGVRPFAGRTASEVRESIEAGRLATPPRRGVPDRIARVLARGLATEPSRRYANIEALTVALRRASSTQGRATKLAALGVVALFGGGLVVLDRAQQDLCVGSEERLDGVWDDDARGRTESTIAATGLAHAADTASRTVQALDAYAERWRAGHRDACEATHVRHEQSAELMDDRMACLHDIRRRLAALVEVLASGDAEVAGHALQAVEGLPPVEACADPIYVSAPIEEADPELRPRIEAVRDEIARAEALRIASRYRDGLTTARQAASKASDLAFAPLVGRALLERGRLEIATGAFDAADASLREALVASLRGRDDEGVFEVTLELTRLLGLHRENVEDGLWWADVARATAERLGDAGSAGVLTLSVAVGQLRERQGRDDDALAVYEDVLAQLRVDGRENSQLFARVLGDVAGIHARSGDLESGLRESQEAARILAQVMGPQHYAMTFPLGNIANILVMMGRHEEAIVQLERVLRLREDTLGPDHPGVADVVVNLGVMLTNLERLEPAMQHLQRALAIYEAALGDDHPKVATCLGNLANVHLARGEFDQTFAALERAVKIREAKLGPTHPHLAITYRNIGNARLDHDEPSAAKDAFDRALAIQEASLGPDHIDLAAVLTGRGQAYLDLERYDDAVADLERAAALREGKTLPPEQRAHMQLALARAVWKSGGDQSRAISLVQGASDLLASSTAPSESLRGEVETWLREHAAPTR